MRNGKTIAIDFDGTLANYKPGMASRDECGGPLKGAVAALKKLKELGFRIIIWTSRPVTETLMEWFEIYGVPYDDIVEKPDVHMFVDDLAITFKGDWKKTLKEIESFQKWWGKSTYKH